MRILQVIPHLSKGGAERVVVELSNALVDSGHEVTLLMAHPVDFALNQKDLVPGVNVQFVSKAGGNRILQYLKIPFWITRNWKNLRTYDVIHCHLTYGLIFGFKISVLRHLSRTRNPHLIATCHIVGGGVSRTHRILNERLSYFFDEFVLMAQDAQWRNFISHKKRKNILVIVNGISANMKENKLRQPRKSAPWVIGTISRLQAERKPWLFLEVFAQIQNLMDEDVRFILGGEGPERESLTALSEKLGISRNLSMPGLVQNPQNILNDLDLYLTLNVEEITGIAGLEAVFSGVLVIGIQLSPAYRNGANDWIWSDQEPNTVAKKVVELSKNPDALHTLSTMQFQVATEKFSIERMRDNYLDLYERKG